MDNKDNIIRALRVIGFDPEFSAKLYSFAKEQWEERIGNFDERLKNIYSRYQTTDIIKFAILKNNETVAANSIAT